MEDLLERSKHGLLYAAKWLTGRGIVALSMFAAVLFPGMSAPYVPLIALPVGLGVATFLTHDENKYNKRRMRNAYRHEVAATLGIDPGSVTIEDLKLVAEGDPKRGIPGNDTLKEQLDRYDGNRNLWFGSHMLAVTVSLGLMATALIEGGLLQGMMNDFAQWLKTSGISSFSIIGSKLGPEVLGAALAAGGISFVVDHIAGYVGQHALGFNEPTTYDRIQQLKSKLMEGENLSPEQVLSVYVHADDQLDAAIKQRYGRHYDDLSEGDKSRAMRSLEGSLHVTLVTDALNSGIIKANELAFVVQGQRSGVPAKKSAQGPEREITLSQFLQTFITRKPDTKHKQEEPSKAASTPNENPVKPASEETPQTRSFVERFSAHSPDGTSHTFVERIEHHAVIPSGRNS